MQRSDSARCIVRAVSSAAGDFGRTALRQRPTMQGAATQRCRKGHGERWMCVCACVRARARALVCARAYVCIDIGACAWQVWSESYPHRACRLGEMAREPILCVALHATGMHPRAHGGHVAHGLLLRIEGLSSRE
jgi:hypothetical protein